MKNDKVRFLMEFKDVRGHKHWSVVTFDNVSRLLTYPSDFVFE